MSSYSHKHVKNKVSNNSNGKCGEITFCIQVGKRVYALNCLYCSQICLQWDMFINHMEQMHDAELNSEYPLQPENDESELQINDYTEDFVPTSEVQHHNTPAATELNTNDSIQLDDPLEEQYFLNPSSIPVKVEEFDYTPNDMVDQTENATNCKPEEQFYPNEIPSVSKLCDVQMYEDHNEVEESKNVDIIKVSNKKYEDATSIQINIKELLSCFKGKNVLSYYKANNTLNNSNRRILCDLIIDKIFEQGFIGCKDMPKISGQIIEVFPSEDKWLYYSPRQFNSKRAPTGFLYHRYYNRLKRIKERTIHKRHNKKDGSSQQ